LNSKAFSNFACGVYSVTASSQANVHKYNIRFLPFYDRKRLVALKIVEPVLARSVVLSVARHRPHTLATREIQALVLSMAPGILTEADAA